MLIEMESDVAANITHERLKNAIAGYQSRRTKENVEALGSGFRFCTLGELLFDKSGKVNEVVTFLELAAHTYFVETGEPLDNSDEDSPLLGVHNGVAVYLLFNGILGDKRVNGGNVLTGPALASLPPHDGPKVIYGEGCRLSPSRQRRENIMFKQIPYQIKVD